MKIKMKESKKNKNKKIQQQQQILATPWQISIVIFFCLLLSRQSFSIQNFLWQSFLIKVVCCIHDSLAYLV